MNAETLAQVERLQEAARVVVRHFRGTDGTFAWDGFRKLEAAAEELDLFLLEPADRRTCFNCKHCTLCIIRRQVNEGLAETRYINIDGEGAPGRWVDVFEALARACMAFEKPQPPAPGDALLVASESDVRRQAEEKGVIE